MNSLTWQQVALVGVSMLAVIASAGIVPEAAPTVASIAFAAVGAAFVNRNKKEDRGDSNEPK